jgi:hypothetical protein
MDAGGDAGVRFAFTRVLRERAEVDLAAEAFRTGLAAGIDPSSVESEIDSTGCALRTGPEIPLGRTPPTSSFWPEAPSALTEIKTQTSKVRSRHNFMSGKLVVRFWPLQVRRAGGNFGPMTLLRVQSIRFRSLPARR